MVNNVIRVVNYVIAARPSLLNFMIADMASAPKPGQPGPGRPPGSKNRRPAPRHDVGKKTKRDRTLKARRERAG
jgi:hypothetical protein